MTTDIEHLIFVRHGESEHHVQNLTGGWTDTPLTRNGRSQVESTAAMIASLGLDEVSLYCSDLKRAAESAAIIGNRIGCRPVALMALREIDNGDGANLTVDEARAIANPQPVSPDLDWRPYPNAETWREMSERVHGALDTMARRHAGTVIVVGHGNSGNALAVAWLGLPVDTRVAFQFDCASITELKVNRWGEREIVRVNVRPDSANR